MYISMLYNYIHIRFITLTRLALTPIGTGDDFFGAMSQGSGAVKMGNTHPYVEHSSSSY